MLNVIIVGGGIGGLTASITLRRAGHKVKVFEKAKGGKSEIGAAVTIAPNGGRILRRLGLDFDQAGLTDYLRSRLVKGDTFELIAPENDHVDFPERFGEYMKTAYRQDLQDALVQLATSKEGDGEPVVLENAVRVVRIDSTSGTVFFANDESASADLVVAADGVHSLAAAEVVGPDCPSLEAPGTTVVRFLIPSKRILEDPETEELLARGDGMCTFNVAADRERWMLRYPCRFNQLQNFVMYTLRSKEHADEQELRFTTDRASLKKELEGFHPSLLKISEMASDVLPLWKCATREPLPTLHRDKLVVIGDAAHPMLPHIGFGAVSAIEDSAALGILLAGVSTSQVEERLQKFDSLRVPRVAVYKYYSDVPMFRDNVAEQREECARYLNPQELPENSQQFRPWLFQYDVTKAAEEMLRMPNNVEK